jgi:hypothetical protein
MESFALWIVCIVLGFIAAICLLSWWLGRKMNE